MIKLAIFDMDGLMFDTERVVGEKLIEVGKDFHYNITMDVRVQMLGRSKKDNIKLLKDNYGEDFPFEDIMKERLKRTNIYYKENGVPVKEGLAELLQFLKENDIYTSVCSSTDHDVVKSHLKSTGVIQYIDYVIGGDQVPNSKPDPTIFLTACEHFHIDPQDAMVFEDSENGILAAYRATIPVICVPDLVEPKPEFLEKVYARVDSLDKAIDILKKSE